MSIAIIPQLHFNNEQNTWLFRVYVGDEILASYMGFQKPRNKDSWLKKLESMGKPRGFFHKPRSKDPVIKQPVFHAHTIHVWFIYLH